MNLYSFVSFFFFFNDTATTEIYTLSLHDALPISLHDFSAKIFCAARTLAPKSTGWPRSASTDRKSTRLNSSHGYISYAVFCLKKKKTNLFIVVLLLLLYLTRTADQPMQLDVYYVS